MTTDTILLPSIVPGVTRHCTYDKRQYTAGVSLDGVEILSRIKGRPWTIATDIDDLVLIADAARGALRLTRES